MRRTPVGAALAANRPGNHASRLRFALPPAGRLRALATACLLALTSACGWQIRGAYTIPPQIAPMAVDGAGGNSVAAELRENLRLNDIELTSGPDAASRLVVSERTERRVLSVGSRGKVDEYELIYTVLWRLEDPDAEAPLIAPVRMQARRDYAQDPDAILGQEDQEGALLEDLRSDLATRILFRLQAWGPEDAPPAPPMPADGA